MFEFAYEATPDLGPRALNCLLWKRGGIVGPLVLVLLPIVLYTNAANAGMWPVAAVLGGGAATALLMFLLVIQQRRRTFHRYLARASDRTVHVRLSDDGVYVRSELGESTLHWSAIERIWHCKHVALFFYHGWTYMTFPVATMPAGALEYSLARVRAHTS
jgi:hypothetical protein